MSKYTNLTLLQRYKLNIVTMSKYTNLTSLQRVNIQT